MGKKILLYSSTFLWVKSDKGLLYNTNNFNAQEFGINKSIKTICNSLLDYDNLYRVSINKTNVDIDDFIELIEQGGFGEVLDNDSENVISLPPLLNLQFSIDRIERNPGLDIGENALTYLHTLSIYTGGSANNKDYYRQITYPVTSTEILDVNAIVKFIERSSSPYIQTINIIISNIENYDIINLCTKLSYLKDSLVLYITLPITGNQKKLASHILSRGFRITFICDFESPISVLLAFKPYLHYSSGVHFNLIVRSIQEYEDRTNLMEKHNIENYSVIPLYDNNIEFFNKNIFLTSEEILGSQLSKRKIFAHQVINTLSFGHLIVMPDGLIYSNVNSKHIGKIEDFNTDIIVKELKENHSWRRIRDSKICKECLYEWLCPSPSDYEIVMKKDCICSNK